MVLIISAVLFAQIKGTKAKTSAVSNQVAVSDPGVSNKNSAGTTAAPVRSLPDGANKPKGNGRAHSKHHKK